MAETYRRHGPPMREVARRNCGEQRAEDVVQEVLLRLWQHPDRFDARRGSLRSFLLVQASRRSVDVLRADGARRAREASEALRPMLVASGVDDAALARVLGDGLCGLLRDLPEPERQAIALAFFGDLTYKQVAAILQIPEGTAKSRIRIGLRRLRAALEAGGTAGTDDVPASHVSRVSRRGAGVWPRSGGESLQDPDAAADRVSQPSSRVDPHRVRTGSNCE